MLSHHWIYLRSEKFVGKQEEMPQRLFCWIHLYQEKKWCFSIWCFEHKSFHIVSHHPPVQVGVYPKMLQLRTAETYIEDLRFERSLADGDEHRFIVTFPSAVIVLFFIFSGRSNTFKSNKSPASKDRPLLRGMFQYLRFMLFQVPKKPRNISCVSWLSTKWPHHPHLFTKILLRYPEMKSFTMLSKNFITFRNEVTVANLCITSCKEIIIPRFKSIRIIIIKYVNWYFCYFPPSMKSDFFPYLTQVGNPSWIPSKQFHIAAACAIRRPISE